MRGRWASTSCWRGYKRRHRASGQADAQMQGSKPANQLEMQKMEAQHQHEMDMLRSSQAQSSTTASAISRRSYGKAKEISGSETTRHLERGRISENESFSIGPIIRYTFVYPFW